MNLPASDFPRFDDISESTRELMQSTVVWDNHACMPLRPDVVNFLPQLERYRRSGVSVVSLNIHFGELAWQSALVMLAQFRHWIGYRADRYRLAETVKDIAAAKAAGQLAVFFDIEGGIPVEPHVGLVEVYYRLGVRWMLLAYNKNNSLGGGCQDEDTGLTSAGRQIIDEIERVGMVLCCSHTGYRTAREAMEHAKKPVIFSHSNARALCDHPRNIPDELIRLCARTGGVISINGLGIFLRSNRHSKVGVLEHIDYVAALVGPEHVGLGLDYVFDPSELDTYIRSSPDLFPPEMGYGAGIPMVGPERFPIIAEALLKRGYSEENIRGILGHNNLRVAQNVWQ
jgi:membrane dipeptidase